MIEQRPDFVHLTVATSFSYGKAVGSPTEIMKLAAHNGGMVGIAEFGSMRSLRDVAKAAKTEGVKLVPGCRLLWCPDASKRAMSREEKEKITAGLLPSQYAAVVAQYEQKHGYTANVRDLGFVTIWALDNEALSGLYEVSSLAWVTGFYYEPRVDPQILARMHGKYAISLGGMNGPIGKLVAKGRTADAIELFRDRWEKFGQCSRCLTEEPSDDTDVNVESLNATMLSHIFVEVHALPMVQCKVWNEFVERELVPLGAKLLLTQPVHYPTREHADSQRAMEAIVNPRIDHMQDAGMPGDFWHFATYDELAASAPAVRCPQFEQAAQNAFDLAQSCQAKFSENPNACITPILDLGGEDPDVRLEKLARDGIKRLKPDWPAEYEERLMHELGSLRRQRFVNYVLYVNDVVDLAKSMNVALGPGRGSAAGSLVLWLLGVTSPHLDPIHHKLLFSRFIDPQRVAPPDVDMDIDGARRHELIAAMRVRYGENSVSHITNFNTERGRGLAKDVCRVLEVPLPTSIRLSNTIDEKMDDGAIEAAFETSPDAQDIDRSYPAIRPLCKMLEGSVRTLGMHAGGVVCSPGPIWKYIPVETRVDKDTDERIIVTAFDMKGVEATGLLKLDALGLRTVTLLTAAEKIVQRKIPGFSLDHIRLDDQPTLDAFTAQDFSGVFQYDTFSSYRLCAGVKFASFEDVSTLTALNRPGPLDCGMADAFLERRRTGEVPIDYHPIVSRITKKTLGVVVYQEQIMEIATAVCGYANPDGLRKMIGKKLVSEMALEGPRFIEGALTHTPDIEPEKAKKLWADIETAGMYVFNKSHSDAYALIAYCCQYLKVHHPIAFYTAALNIESDSPRIRAIVADATAHGVQMLPPDINLSGSAFEAMDNGVMCSLGHLRGVGQVAGAAIVANRTYADFEDFMKKVSRQAVNSRVIGILAAAGAFGDMIPNPRAVHDAWDAVSKDQKRKKPKYKTWLEGFDDLCKERWSVTKAKLEMAKANPAVADDPFAEFLEKSFVEPPPDDMADVDGANCWLAGCVADKKEDAIGRFGDKSGPEFDARKGQAFCTFMLVSGEHKVKVKVDWSEYALCKEHLADGKFVAVHGTFDARWSTFRAHAVLDLAEELEKESLLGSCLMRRSPLLQLSKPDKNDRYNWKLDVVLEQARRGDFSVVPVAGIVTHVRPKVDSKGKEMAWVGILHPTNAYVEVTFFASRWKADIKEIVVPGKAICIMAEINHYNGRVSWICGDDSIVEPIDIDARLAALRGTPPE